MRLSPMLPMLFFPILLAGSYLCIRSEDLTSGVVSDSYKRALHLKLRAFVPIRCRLLSMRRTEGENDSGEACWMLKSFFLIH